MKPAFRPYIYSELGSSLGVYGLVDVGASLSEVEAGSGVIVYSLDFKESLSALLGILGSTVSHNSRGMSP